MKFLWLMLLVLNANIFISSKINRIISNNHLWKQNCIHRLQTLSKMMTVTTFTTTVSVFSVLPILSYSEPVYATTGISLSSLASKIPGYGQPDIFYPSYFQDWPYLEKIQTLITTKSPLIYSSKYIVSSDSSDGSNDNNGDKPIILDRGFTFVSKYNSLYGELWSSKFDFNQPNNLVLSNSKGLTEDVRVTKRSVENIEAPLTFGYSEFSRIAATISSGIQSSVPQIFATRTLARFKARESESRSVNGVPVMGNVNEIQGVERLYVYANDPSSLQTVPEDQPTFIIKSTLIMTRE